ncbi:MAG: helix-turn-helix domain-containing protein [Lachnospiraceae bacterium]|nr:helix-turn-helix domain-containing protein [Lachnospiraceae bacterium]
MSEVYESIIGGLSEAVEDQRKSENEKILKRRMISVVPVKKYTGSEIKQIRHSVGMTQKAFSCYLGVSEKTVEAWESGKNQPSGAASRILSMMEMDHNLIREFPLVAME